MIHTSTVTIAGRECLLIVAAPDWSVKPKLELRLPAEIDEGLTGIQSRRPDAATPRLSMTYTVDLDGADLQQLRTAIGAAGNRRIAMPIWPDLIAAAYGESWADRVFASQISLGMGDNYADVTIYENGAAPLLPYQCPVMIGRVRTADVSPETDATGSVKLQLDEDGPWEYRVEINGSDPSSWSANWKVDWSGRVTETARNLLQLGSIGRARQRVVEGEPVRFMQQRGTLGVNGRAGLRDFLAFWVGRKGPVEPFDFPGLLRPGTTTPTAPHDFDATVGRMRFADDKLKIDFLTPNFIDVSLRLEQQIETVASAAQPAYAHLYEIEQNGLVNRITDWEAPISASGHTWQPARIEHGRIRQSLRPQNEECEITAALEDVPAIEPMLRMELELPASVQIWELELPASTPQLLFSGSITKIKGSGNELRITAAAFAGALKRKVPRYQWSNSCNFALFSPGCRRLRPVDMDSGAWMYQGVISNQWNAEAPRVILSSFVAPVGKPSLLAELERYFAGGWLEIGWGTTSRQLREITWSGTHTQSGEPDRLFLAMSRMLRDIAADEPVRFWPGCDGSFATCGNKFANGNAFGGFPHQPAWIEQASAGIPKGGK